MIDRARPARQRHSTTRFRVRPWSKLRWEPMHKPQAQH